MDSYQSSKRSIFVRYIRQIQQSRLGYLWLEWIVFSAIILVGVGLASTRLWRVDLMIQDVSQRFVSRQISDEIIIIAIDDKSLQAIGRWPWRRAFHAALLDQIHADQSRVVGLDLILSENDPGSVADDSLLASAIGRAGNVVLPIVLTEFGGVSQIRAMRPIGPFADQARALAHINLELDTDGITRSLFLREGQDEGADRIRWYDHLSLAMLRVGFFQVPDPLPGIRAPQNKKNTNNDGSWHRENWVQIPFAGAAGKFKTVSYIDVLRGEIPWEFFAHKYIFVGATALGMGDAYTTPYSSGAELVPGVEISAYELNALLLNYRLERAASWQNTLFCIGPVLLALLAMLLLAPTTSLLVSIILILTCLASTWAGINYSGIIFAPTSALLGLLLGYPIWVWRRQVAALRYLLEEFRRMGDRRELPAMLPTLYGGDLLERHIDALQNASRQLRSLYRFVSDTIESLPDVTLIASLDGVVSMANQSASNYFGLFGISKLRGVALQDLLLPVRRADSALELFGQTWPERSAENWSCEVRDSLGNDLLFKCVPCFNFDGKTNGWIVSLVDISPIRQAERQRDEALRFITHDMRSPQSSILALLALQRMHSETPIHKQTLERIEGHARHTLALAEEFVQLARAESSAYSLRLVDLTALLEEAIDDVWAQAEARQIQLLTEFPVIPASCLADRSLLVRAIINLLSNAIKFNREQAPVLCEITEVQGGWRLAVTDKGPGLTVAQQESLFRPFGRIVGDDHAKTAGVGLGLVFVRTVIERHGSNIKIESQPGLGATFHFTLPSVTAEN